MEKSNVRRRKKTEDPAHVVDDNDEISIRSGNKFSRRTFCYLAAFTMLLSTLYAYATSPISSVVIDDYSDVESLKWAQVVNSDLQNGEKILTELPAPESIVVNEEGKWYTGLEDGRIVEIINGEGREPVIKVLTEKIRYTAGGERQRRRPLGMRLFDRRLYVADADQGVFLIDTEDRTWEKIVGYDDVYPAISFTNDLTITSDEKTIYFTDSSTRRQYHEVIYTLVEGECSGRVFKADVISKNVQLILDKLCFANGIQLSTDETKLLVSENTRARIIVVDIASEEIVKTIHLPRGTDNIRPAKGGGYWVPMPVPYDPYVAMTHRYPFIRDILAKVLGLEGMKKFVSFQGAVAKLNPEFEPISVHYDLDGKIGQVISEVQEYEKGKFLMGSPVTPGIVRIEGLGLK